MMQKKFVVSQIVAIAHTLQHKVTSPMLSMGKGAVRSSASRVRQGAAKSLLTAMIVGGMIAGAADSAAAQTLVWNEEFEAPLNYTTKWAVYDNVNPKQRTYYGFYPTLMTETGVGFARIKHETWNPDHPGFFKGTLLYAWQRHDLAAGSKTYEARLRINVIKAGTVHAFYRLFQKSKCGRSKYSEGCLRTNNTSKIRQKSG